MGAIEKFDVAVPLQASFGSVKRTYFLLPFSYQEEREAQVDSSRLGTVVHCTTCDLNPQYSDTDRKFPRTAVAAAPAVTEELFPLRIPAGAKTL